MDFVEHSGGWHVLHALLDPVVDVHAPRVLLIDDDPNLGEIVSALLAAFGYDFQGADRQSGLARFESGEWDLVLVDLVRGWELIETIRQRAPNIPVVLLTGLADSTLLSRARGCRVRVVVKPFRLQTLKATLAEALYARIG
jgi:CheY-like chemotaxis protein